VNYWKPLKVREFAIDLTSALKHDCKCNKHNTPPTTSIGNAPYIFVIRVVYRTLRRKIYLKAKSEKAWRFWGLYVHVCRMEMLQEA
jgi:hypothetical protein